jgi:glycosyltransferase involved in cell wall biosynthesis
VASIRWLRAGVEHRRPPHIGYLARVRVVVNAVPVRGNSLGIVVENMLTGWEGLHAGDDLHVVVPPDLLDLPKTVTVHPVPQRGWRGDRTVAMNVLVPQLCRQLRADAMLGVTPATTIAPLPCPRALIALDVRHEVHPEQFSLRTRLLRGAGYGIGFRQADGIACISERTRDDIVRGHPFLAGRRIRTTPLGADHVLSWPAREAKTPYALSFGQWGNKNVDLTLEAWTILQSQGDPLPLVLVGLPDHEREAVAARVAALDLSNLVTIRPWLSRDEFQRCFASAALVVFPSDHEGFGLPAIEAMRLGIPLVITPDKALLETTAGLATVTRDWSPESLALAVPKALRSSPEELKVCVEHAATFTWQRMAGQVRSLIEDCVKGRTARS